MFVFAMDTITFTITPNLTSGNSPVDLTGMLSADLDAITGSYIGTGNNPSSGIFSVTRVEDVPEPTTLGLLGVGFVAWAQAIQAQSLTDYVRRKRHQRRVSPGKSVNSAQLPGRSSALEAGSDGWSVFNRPSQPSPATAARRDYKAVRAAASDRLVKPRRQSRITFGPSVGAASGSRGGAFR